MDKLTLMISALLFLGLNFASAQAVTDNFRQKFIFLVYNCNNDEFVNVYSTLHVVDKVNGFHFNIHGFGIGEKSQARYDYNTRMNYMVEENHGMEVGSFVLNGPGQVPDVRGNITLHYTINANEELVVDSLKVKEVCN